jgi:hypothetical protein
MLLQVPCGQNASRPMGDIKQGHDYIPERNKSQFF